METEFTFSAETNGRDAPDGVELTPNQGTRLTLDNYDVNMDTIDGKDTLHATGGICYQNKHTTNTKKNLMTSLLASGLGEKDGSFIGKNVKLTLTTNS